MLKEGKIYVPKDEKLRVDIIQLHHDVLAVEHGEGGKQWSWLPGITGG